jgi:UDP-N-acetylmuramate dehydrogenase
MISFDEPLSKHTTYKIGGPAKFFARPKTVDELVEILQKAKKENWAVKFIGRGSNLLFSDDGYDGLIIKTDRLKKVEISKVKDSAVVTAQAGVPLVKLSSNLVKELIVGFEWANSIPGSVGGAVFMNAGVNSPNGDTQISEVFESGLFVTKDLEIVELNNSEMQFKYRTSLLQKNPDYLACIQASFLLRTADEREVSLIKEKIKKSKKNRVDTQPLNFPSCGSVFRNPKPLFAGQLIESLNLKGYAIGGASVSTKHANWIVNNGNAKADDVLAIINHIRKMVKQEFGIDLKVEVEIVR